MRSLCWCSAASVVLLLAGCGATRVADPYAYDHDRPLAVRDQGVALSGPKVAMHVISFAGAKRVNAFLVVPRTGGTHPAVLFLHGSGGNREDLLLPALQLASRGFVTMTISQPNDAATFRPLVVNARRALDLLAARKDVDASRLGLVGFSLGAQTAAILAGDEPRLKAIGIVAGRGSGTPLSWIAKAKSHLFFQAGTRDAVVPHAQLVALIKAAPDDPLVRWYPTGHGMNRRAFDDQIAWQAREIGFRPHGGH
jgi:dienelactone hydrolase